MPAEGPAARQNSPTFLSRAYLEKFIPDELHVSMAPDASRTVVSLLAATVLLGSYPHQFDKTSWIDEISYDPTTFKTLREDQAGVILGIGVRSGVLEHNQETGEYWISSEKLHYSMQALFDLVVDPNRRWD